jgi:hypothetical protein
MRFFTLIVIFIGGSLPALAWESDGHRIVARVAASLIRKKTRRFVRDHLDPRAGSSMMKFESALVKASNWADTVVDELPWSRELHFTHTPYMNCSPFDLARDCGVGGSRKCLVTAVADYCIRAGDVSLSPEERAEALKFLIHFIADGHQPLHTGFARDAGGNEIHLSDPKSLSLHQTWDSLLVESFKRSNAFKGDGSWYGAASTLSRELDDHKEKIESMRLPGLIPGGSHEAYLQVASDMVTDTVMTHTCQSAYMNEDGQWIETGSALSSVYISTRTEVVKEQLLKASVRLAQFLDGIAESFFEAERQIEGALDGEMSQLSTNPFEPLQLDFDFDSEEAVFEMPVEEDEVQTESKVDDVVVQTTTVKLTPSTITLSPEDRKRIQNRKKKLRHAVNKRRICGVDIESLVLIKRGRKFIVTYRHFVTSDNFSPSPFISVSVRFAGMSSSEPARIFLFDMEVFPVEHYSDPELVNAVFRKLAGLNYETGVAGSGSVQSFSVAGKTPKQSRDAISKLIADLAESTVDLSEEESAPMYDLVPVTFESVADFVRPKVPKYQIKLMYDGQVPSETQRILDIIRSQSSMLVSIMFGKIYMVTRSDLLMDKSNRRWVFNRLSVIDSTVSLTDSYWLYVDARVLDDVLIPQATAEISRVVGTASNRKLLRQVLQRGHRILDSFAVLCQSLKDGSRSMPESWQAIAAFAAMRSVERPTEPRMNTIEYVLRTPEEEARILKMMPGVPAIPRVKGNNIIP